MERALRRAGPRDLRFALRLAAARLRDRLGVPGLLGLLLAAVAIAVGLHAWTGQRQHLEQRTAANAAPGTPAEPPDAAPPARPVALPRLPAEADTARVLARIQRTALESGLGWPKGDYRFNPASGEAPASLEVRTTLQGPYPAVRQFVTALLLDFPSLTLREFSLSRASAETPTVEARIAIVVYLSAGTPTSVPGDL